VILPFFTLEDSELSTGGIGIRAQGRRRPVAKRRQTDELGKNRDFMRIREDRGIFEESINVNNADSLDC